jgi:hypothetical protein
LRRWCAGPGRALGRRLWQRHVLRCSPDEARCRVPDCAPGPAPPHQTTPSPGRRPSPRRRSTRWTPRRRPAWASSRAR